VSPVSLIRSLQSDALVREIEQQLKDEKSAIAAGAKRDAHAVMAQARAAARTQVHEAIEELREEGARRLTRAKAQLDTERRARAQYQAAKAIGDAVPLLQQALEQRWRDRDSRRQWTDAVASLCARRLRSGAWAVEHPKDWSAQEQKQFIKAIGDGTKVSFKAAGDVDCGLRIKSDQAVLDATPRGLLADATTIAALLLDEIGGGAK
jgi:F0F1-type ATP synthase membrane subunit b/b'